MTTVSSDQCALLTPPGGGAIAVIQISGPRSNEILNACFHAASAGTPPIESSRLIFGKFKEADETIDDVIVGMVRTAKHDNISLYTHGGVRVVERMMEALEHNGARMLTSASASVVWCATSELEQESLNALTHARTERGVRFLCRQRQHLAPAITQLTTLAETDLPAAKAKLSQMTASFEAVQYLLYGATIALIGKPNAGKSTLFNRLVGRPAAVVTPLPGTTRDWVSQTIEIRGIPITIIDTAGLRETNDRLEQQAIGAGREIVARADLCIEVQDIAEPQHSPPAITQDTSDPDCNHIVVHNKVDLLEPPTHTESTGSTSPRSVVQISARSGYGLDQLACLIESRLGFSDQIDTHPHLFTARQLHLAQSILSDSRLTAIEMEQILRGITNKTSLDGGPAGI